jgi:signal transduction histidine kinase
VAEPETLRLAKQVYRLRTLGLGIGILPIVAVLYEHGTTSPPLYIAAFANGFIWPHIAWWHSKSSADSHRAERINLLIDSALGGMWVAVMQFSLLPSVLLVSMLTMDKLGWGRRFLLRSSVVMAAALGVTALIVRPPFRPETTMLEIVAALPLMVAYPIAVALAANQSGRLSRERRKAIEQTTALREQLAHVARVGTLGEMAAGLAHELNQPLAAIHLEANAALELGKDGMPDWPDTRESLERISEQSFRAGEIVKRMRTFARRGQVARERLSVVPLLQEVVSLLDHDLKYNNVQTTIELPGDLPDVVADRIAIQQVLVNLIRNAVEAMSNPANTNRWLDVRAERAGGFVRVSVTDTGGGIEPAILERLFHPFHSTKASGMGLGLSICQSLIESNGGHVGAGPHPAGGARFYFEIPAA